MSDCDQELCPHWTGHGCACAVLGVERGDTGVNDDLQAGLEDRAISVDDADEIREFAAFLRAAGPHPNAPGHDPARYRQAVRDYYPDEDPDE